MASLHVCPTWAGPQDRLSTLTCSPPMEVILFFPIKATAQAYFYGLWMGRFLDLFHLPILVWIISGIGLVSRPTTRSSQNWGVRIYLHIRPCWRPSMRRKVTFVKKEPLCSPVSLPHPIINTLSVLRSKAISLQLEKFSFLESWSKWRWWWKCHVVHTAVVPRHSVGCKD